MVSWCCICKLTKGVVENVSFHSIPKNDEQRAKWLKLLNKRITKTSLVCSQHFQENDFIYKIVGDEVRRFLKKTAVPTLLLNNHESEVDANSLSKTNVNCLMEHDTNCLSEPDESTANNAQEVMSITVLEHTHNQAENCSSKNPEVVLNTELINSSSNVHYEITALKDKMHGSIKRKNNEGSENQTKKLCNPRYIGDLQREHFTTDSSFYIVQKYHQETEKKLNTLHQKLNRLQKRFDSLQSLMKNLKSTGLLSKESANAVEMSLHDNE